MILFLSDTKSFLFVSPVSVCTGKPFLSTSQCASRNRSSIHQGNNRVVIGNNIGVRETC